MSQAHWQNELRIPGGAHGAASRLSPPRVDDQAGRGDRRRRGQRVRRRFWPSSCSTGCAIRRPGCAPALASPHWSGAAVVPWFLHRWVWRFRRLEQLARLLSRKMPRSATSCWASSSLPTIAGNKAARSPSARRRSSKSPKTRGSTDFRTATPAFARARLDDRCRNAGVVRRARFRADSRRRHKTCGHG